MSENSQKKQNLELLTWTFTSLFTIVLHDIDPVKVEVKVRVKDRKVLNFCLQCFHAVGLAAGRASGL